MALPILPHYGDKWADIYNDTTSKLQKIFRTSNEVIIVPIPGHLAVEMAVANLVTRGEEAYVCSNGVFSEDIIATVKQLGGKPVEIKSKWGAAVTGAQVAEVLDSKKDLTDKPLFLVHNETSTGVVNPAEEIFRVCKKHGMITALDAISGFGGIDVRVDEWDVDYAIGYASKALGGVFGAQPVALSKEVWDVAKRNQDKIFTRYLNLNTWTEARVKMGPWGHPYPYSMPSSVIVGLRKAADIVLQEGLENRYRRHAEVAKFARARLKAMGLEIFPEEKSVSSTLSVPRVDPAWEKEMRRQLVEKYDIMIGSGTGELTGRVVRIGHMGTSASYSKVSLTLMAMESILRELRNVT